jgi:phosphopantetheinyl transferase (holo-ACP synthase)
MTGSQPPGVRRFDWRMPLDQPLTALPTVLVGCAADAAARRQALAAAAASILAAAPGDVRITHDSTGAPLVALGEMARGDVALGNGAAAHLAEGNQASVEAWRMSALNVSSASRGSIAALALAAEPVGVDIETVALDADIPWNVLHPRERAALAELPEPSRCEAFLRIWTVKEAYLKALRLGLTREPSSFAVAIDSDGSPAIEDATGAHGHAETRRLVVAGTAVIVSAVLLA